MSNGPDATDSIRETACHQVGSEQSCKLPLHNVLLSLRTLTVLLVAIPLAIIAIAVLRNVYLDIFGAKTMFGRLTPLGLEEEDSITDWYTSLLHAFIAALLVLSGRIEPIARWKPYWFGLAGIFIYLSMDEAAALHEMWMGPLERFEFTGVLTYSWIIPFALLCLLLGLIYLPFLRSREPQLRRITILAGLIFVGSALGLEMVEGYCATHFGWRGQCFQWSMNIEETGEMASLTIFALALLRDFRRRYSGVTVEIA